VAPGSGTVAVFLVADGNPLRTSVAEGGRKAGHLGGIFVFAGLSPARERIPEKLRRRGDVVFTPRFVESGGLALLAGKALGGGGKAVCELRHDGRTQKRSHRGLETGIRSRHKLRDAADRIARCSQIPRFVRAWAANGQASPSIVRGAPEKRWSAGTTHPGSTRLGWPNVSLSRVDASKRSMAGSGRDAHGTSEARHRRSQGTLKPAGVVHGLQPGRLPADSGRRTRTGQEHCTVAEQKRAEVAHRVNKEQARSAVTSSASQNTGASIGRRRHSQRFTEKKSRRRDGRCRRKPLVRLRN